MKMSDIFTKGVQTVKHVLGHDEKSDEQLLKELSFYVCYDYHSYLDDAPITANLIKERFLKNQAEHPLLRPVVEALATIPYSLLGSEYATKDAVESVVRPIYEAKYPNPIAVALSKSAGQEKAPV
jgi:hypothetical protein